MTAHNMIMDLGIGKQELCEKIMHCLREADIVLETVQHKATIESDFAALNDLTSPLHSLDDVSLALSDARAAMVAYMEHETALGIV